MKYLRALWVIVFGLVAMATAGGSTSRADVYDLTWHTIDAGGAVESSGGAFSLSGTIGQPDAGALSGGAFTLTGGFWFPQMPGDCNVDGGVDLHDYGTFGPCITGPGGGPVQPPCHCFDLDGDQDVDLEDWRAFVGSFTG